MLSSVLELLANFKSTYFASMNTPNMLALFLLEKNEIMLLTYEKNGRGMILFHSRGKKFSYHG